MATVHQHPAALAVPPAAVMRVLERFPRRELEGFIAVALELLDTLDGDPEAEDGTDLEDDFTLTTHAELSAEGAPGCPIADAHDPSWIEWNKRSRNKLRIGGHEPSNPAGHEDDEQDDHDEDDDPAGGAADDLGESDPSRGILRPVYGIDQSQGPINEREAYRQHLAAIRSAPIVRVPPNLGRPRT